MLYAFLLYILHCYLAEPGLRGTITIVCGDDGDGELNPGRRPRTWPHPVADTYLRVAERSCEYALVIYVSS